jgi:DNA-binding NarL/FixJ family response regulator
LGQFSGGAANGTSPEQKHGRSALSKREREITALITQGLRNRDIADKLFISEQTVKNHIHNIFDKTGVSDRLELALYAIHQRLPLDS